MRNVVSSTLHTPGPNQAKAQTQQLSQRPRLTVGLLEASAGAATTELLRLDTPGVSDDEAAVVRGQDVLDLLLGGLIDELLVVGHDALGNGLADGVDLRSETSALHADPDVELAGPLLAEEQEWLVHLGTEDVGLDGVQGAAVQAEVALASADKGNGNGGLLTAEALDEVLGLALGGLNFVRHGFYLSASSAR